MGLTSWIYRAGRSSPTQVGMVTVINGHSGQQLRLEMNAHGEGLRHGRPSMARGAHPLLES
jgi:hypothetical protein